MKATKGKGVEMKAWKMGETARTIVPPSIETTSFSAGGRSRELQYPTTKTQPFPPSPEIP
jgi:hypothetical protein